MQVQIEIKGTSPLLMHNGRLSDPDDEWAREIAKITAKRNWNRKDWWITSDEALACGLIDRIDSALTVAE